MDSTTNQSDIVAKVTTNFIRNSPSNNGIHRLHIRSQHYKSLEVCQIIEICFLNLIFLEHTLIFLLTFRRQSLKRTQSDQNQRSILLLGKSFLHSCLHRNWIRAFSFSNICLSVVYFALLMLKHFHANLVQPSSPTLYSLPLNLLQQININFSTFHLFFLSISVFQYFLRYYRLLKSTYSSYSFNGQNLLLTKHTNVALILSGSLALIFGYNFVFYNSTESHTRSFLPLITLNMILLPLINMLIFFFILICFLLNLFFKSNIEHVSVSDEQENLRLMIEKKMCIKCYSKIIQTNPNLFQDKNYSYRNLYQNFCSNNLHSSYPFRIKRNYFSSKKKKTTSQTDLSIEQENPLFDQQTSMKFNNQHSSCQLSHYFLLILLFKYILFTFPENTIQMYLYFSQFYQLILKKTILNQYIPPFDEKNNSLLLISRFLFLFSRFGDSLLLIRLPYLIKKYFPCWCHFNSKFLREQQTSHRILTAKYSESSTNEPTSPLDITNLNENEQRVSVGHTHRQRFQLQFQFMPLWSRHRPRLFRDSA